MNFKVKHFPIFLCFYILINSCQDKDFNTNEFSKRIANAEIKFKNREFDSAFYFYNKAFVNCEADEIDRKLFVIGKLAQIQNNVCDFVGAEKTLIEAFEIIPFSKRQDYINNIYNELGISFQEQRNYEEALKYYNRCIENESNETNLLILKNNCAVVHLENQNPQKAIQTLLPLAQDSILDLDKTNKARVLDNLGFSYFKIGSERIAQIFLNQALDIRLQLNDEYQKIASYMHLAKFFEKKDSNKSFNFAKKAFESSSVSKSPDDQLEALDLMIKKADNEETKSYFARYVAINDSVTKIRQSNKNQFAKLKWDFTVAIKEAEIQKTQKIIYFLLFLFTVYAALHLYFAIKRKNKIKLQNATYETETRISKRLHDELANDTFNTLTFSQYNNLEDKENKEFLLHQLEIMYARARNISRENSDIDLSENYFDSLKKMIATFENDNTNVILNTNDLKELKLNNISKIALYRSLQEFMINMKKHSHATVVVISFKEHSDIYEINYSDNGIGISDALKFKNGLANVENRIKSSKGSITFETESIRGLKIKVTLPKK